MTWHLKNTLTYFMKTFPLDDQFCTFISESGWVYLNGNKMLMTTVMTLTLSQVYL